MSEKTSEKQWALVAHDLQMALTHASRAFAGMEEMDVPHISENFKPVIERLRGFRDLVDEKVERSL